MKRLVLRHGLGAGGILAGLMALTMPLIRRGTLGFGNSELVGYTGMVLAFLLVFFGIRSYRNDVAGGTIGFAKAFQVGILITVVASLVYVLTWQVIYWGFFPDFGERYQAHLLAEMRAEGESEAEIRETEQKMATFIRLYKNPLFNVAVTFLEIFPVGLVVTLVSAGILRRKPAAGVREPLAA